MMKHRASRAVVCIAGLLMLAATWYAMFWWLAAMTESLLAPWDTAPGRPPMGTLARSVNDFFEDAPGAYLPAATAVAAGVALLVVRAVQGRWRAWLPALLASTYALFVVLDVLAFILNGLLVERWLPSPRTGYDLGYHRAWPGILLTVVLLALLYWAQWRATAGLGASPGARGVLAEGTDRAMST